MQGAPLIKGFPAQNVLADKGYDGDSLIETIRAATAQAVIPPKANRKNPQECDYALYAERHRVECFFNRLKQYRGIATRYCKRVIPIPERDESVGIHRGSEV